MGKVLKGIGGALFGKRAKSKSASGNYNNDMLTGALGSSLGYVGTGGNLMASLLGAGGADAQNSALSNFANSGGMKFLLGKLS